MTRLSRIAQRTGPLAADFWLRVLRSWLTPVLAGEAHEHVVKRGLPHGNVVDFDVCTSKLPNDGLERAVTIRCCGSNPAKLLSHDGFGPADRFHPLRGEPDVFTVADHHLDPVSPDLIFQRPGLPSARISPSSNTEI